jgi:hypothetical protein
MKPKFFPIFLMPLALVLGQDAQTHISGTWRLSSDKTTQLLLDLKDDSIHVKESKGAETLADYTCNTMGKECKVKEQGHAAMVSYWFNGPKLVEMKVRGSNVVKRRFELDDGGKTLKVELNQIVPNSSHENLTFARDQE